MPLVRSSASKRRLRLVSLILSLGEIIPSYSRYIEKGLSYIIILAPFSRQFSFYAKCTKLNIRSSYNIKSVSNAKYIYLICSCVLRSLQLPYLICFKVLRGSIYCEI